MERDTVPTAELPEQVRTRVIALAADALPLVSDLPASVRRVATFAPNRRAKLGGTMIAAALENDSDFRGHLVTQIAASLPALADLIAEGAVPAAADPVEVAALLWLARPEAWETAYADAVRRVEAAHSFVDEGAIDRLNQKLEAAEQQAREQRVKHKERVDELKAENTTLRRKLGEARATQRAASHDVEQSLVDASAKAAAAETAQAAAETEVRRLRGQVEELQSQLAGIRRESRTERDEVTLRARLLLDTLLDAGQGLRRELALPPVTGSPAARLEDEIDHAERGSAQTAAQGPSDPVLLENYLAMPRVRLLIDGYNVSKEGWPSSSLEAQRVRLLNGLASLVARTGAETTVVFDAASVSKRPMVSAPRGVRVLFSPEGVIADDVIRDLVAAEPEGRVVVVVSSDREVARDVRRAGARAVGAGSLLGLITR